MQAQTFVFFGQVGSGKGTQVKLLTEFLKSKGEQACAYIGTGDLFRKIIESSDGDTEAESIKERLNTGQLISDEITNGLVEKAMKEKLAPSVHAIFDGYPRTVAQAGFFEEKMEFYGRQNIKIIYIELSEAEAMKRNLLRGRHDDTEAGLRKRFEEYEKNVVPAMNYFKGKKNYEILTINGEQSIEKVHEDIISALES